MRFHIGEIPDSPDFVPDSTWMLVRQPTPWVMQLLALPIGLTLAVFLGVLWLMLTPVGRGPPPSARQCLGALLAIVPAHEALHLAMHPRTGDSIFGVWPSRLLFYTHYHNQLPCRRYIGVLLLPVVILSLVPLLACALTAAPSAFLAAASVINALLACGDLFTVGLLLAQVPLGATLRNKGWRVYWKGLAPAGKGD